jgi:hypothetical protein
VSPKAGQRLLLNPNKANTLLVNLPSASVGPIPLSVVVPAAGAGTRGQVWQRTLAFRQPLSGPAVDPNLHGLSGTLPRWGAGGNGSVDLIEIESDDGKDWRIAAHSIGPRIAPHSLLETVSAAPASSLDPMALPAPILLWSAADLLSSVSSGTSFAAGTAVGSDYSGSGNNLIVNTGDTMTFHRGPVPGSGAIARGLSGYPYVSGSGSRAGMGCVFSGGPISSWTILVALVPGDQTQGGGFDEERVFTLRPVAGDPVLVALKYGNMGYTWDGRDFNNIYWDSTVFAGSRPAPTVIGWSAQGGRTYGRPDITAGSLSSPVAPAAYGSGTTTTPSEIIGFDIDNAYAICAAVVYATALSAEQTAQAARRLAYVGYGGTD